MRIAVLGGTFDPVHLGHLHLAEEVLATGRYDRIFFIPAFLPAHKDKPQTTPHERLEMLGLALSDSHFEIEPCEIERKKMSYSIDTIDYLYARLHPVGHIGFVIGDDLVSGLPTWKEADNLMEKVDLIIAHRTSRSETKTEYRHYYLQNPLIDISSGDIRRRIKTGKPFRYMLPEKVYGYVQSRNLYRTH